MERFTGHSIPAIAAAHVAALTTAAVSPVFRDAQLFFRWRVGSPLGGFSELRQGPSPAAILRDWRPRPAERPSRQWWKTAAQSLVSVFDRLGEWHDRAKSRRALLAMDDHALSDIGISRATAEYEANLPFWRIRP